jgi:hypothetical protein
MFLLIGNGKPRAGQRPPTSLAFYTGVKLQLWNGTLWRDSNKALEDVMVYAQWLREPTPQQVSRAKAKLARCAPETSRDGVIS